MKRITDLRTGERPGARVRVFLDGRYAFSLEPEVAVKEGLRVGNELSTDEIEALAKLNMFQRSLSAGMHFLGYRPRSEAEVRERLIRRGFDVESVESALARLKELGLIDDSAFARFWKDNRETFSPRSQFLTRLELRRKGVASAIIDEVAGTIDDADSAYRAALKKAGSVPRSDYEVFSRRLGGYLRRRGFGYGVINQAVNRLWREGQEN